MDWESHLKMLEEARKTRSELAAAAVDRATRLRAAAAAGDWKAVDAIKAEVFGGGRDGQEVSEPQNPDAGTADGTVAEEV